MVGFIRFYQKWMSPLLGPRCRFYPSCSHYALACFEKYPRGRAFLKVLCRLGRCHPLNAGGVDLP